MTVDRGVKEFGLTFILCNFFLKYRDTLKNFKLMYMVTLTFGVFELGTEVVPDYKLSIHILFFDLDP